MAILSNINGKFAVESTGAIQFNGSNGTSGYVLKSNGNTSPTWVDPDTIIGPYLPLSGGTLTGTTSTAAGIAFNVGGTLTGTSATFTGNIATAADKRISVGTWDNSAFTGGNAYGFSVTSSLPLLHLTESDQTNKKGYVGLSGGSMYVGGLISNLYLQSGASGTTALAIDSSQNATFAGKIIPNANIELPYGGELRTLDSAGGVRTIARANSNKLQYGWSYAGEVEFMGGGSYTPRITINTDGSTTFAGKIIASEGVQFTGGSIATATAVLHTNNIIYFRGGSNGLFIQNADGSDGYYISNSDHTWDVGSSAAMKLNSTGLGIGTTSPTALLDVSSGTTTDVIRFGANSRWGFSRANSDNRYLSFMRNQNGSGTAVWTVDGDNGNVTIGNTSSVQPLTVAGNVLFRTTTADSFENRFQFIVGGAGDAGNFYVYDAAETAAVRLNGNGDSYLNGGNVGIGTTSPAAKLDVRNTGQGGIELWPEGLAVAGTNLINNYDRTGDNFVDFEIRAAQYNWKIGTSSKMVMLSNGNVGIGTTSPTANLHVQNASTATLKVITTGVADASVNIQGYDAGVHIGDVTNGLRWAIWNDGPSTSSSLKFGSYALGTWYNDASQVVTMKSDGKVGIGTVSPGQKLEVAGRIRVTTDPTLEVYEASNKRGGFQWDSTNDYVNIFSTGGDMRFDLGGERMRITSGGNVGIGTTGPTTWLSVSDGASMYANNNYLVQIKRNATNSDDDTSKASILLANNSNAMQIAYGGTTDRLRIIDGGGVERFTMLNGGNIGLSTTNPDAYNSHGRDLVIVRTGNCGISIISGSSSSGSLLFGDGTGGTAAYRGKIEYDHSADAMEFRTAATTRMELNSSGTLTVSGDLVAYGSPSDKRLKENIKPIKNPLGKIKKLKGITFDWKKSESILDIKEDYGFIAQDVQKVIPELVRKNENELLSMRHQGIIPILVEAIKELEARVKELENK